MTATPDVVSAAVAQVDRRSRLPRRLRLAILERDGYRCVYCGRGPRDSLLEVDHVIPRAVGGSDDPTNLVTSCKGCNGAKSTSPVALPPDVDVSKPLPAWYTTTVTRRSGVAAIAVRDTFDRRFDEWRAWAPTCDSCRAPADTIHFWPWVIDCERVLFACPDHDHGGYWIYVRDLFRGPEDYRYNVPWIRYTLWDHIEAKGIGEVEGPVRFGEASLDLLLKRIAEWQQ